MDLRKKQQGRYLLLALIVAVAIGGFFYVRDPMVAVNWFFGIAIGVVLQRSKFCMTAAFRDIALFKLGGMAKGLLITIFVSTIGYFAVRKWALAHGLSVPGNFDPIGWHTVVGAVLFGAGMVIAGGCASGTLMRMGEGYAMQWLVFAGLILGSVAGSYNYTWWEPGEAVLLDRVIGLWPAFIAQLLFLCLLYVLVGWWEKRS